MGQKELLFAFEDKYRFLYDIEVNGVPIYTCLRDGVCARLQGNTMESISATSEKGRVFIKRLIDSGRKIYSFRKMKTLIFTSSMYRRDKGRNLAAEYLMQKYPDAAVFEWPSRNEVYDSAYFKDGNKEKYCPLDFYIVIYKVYLRLFQRKYRMLYKECEDKLTVAFREKQHLVLECEQAAIEYLMTAMPESYVTTTMSQDIFKKLFQKYHHVEYAIDFWGSARENIIPVLSNQVQSIELQHGIITRNHPGYIYPDFAVQTCSQFVARKMLVYGENTKQLLTQESVFGEEFIEVIGNPRIKMYKEDFKISEGARKLILFTSQPFEQDGVAADYYHTMIPILTRIEKMLTQSDVWNGYQLGIKLHPRENNGGQELYAKELKHTVVFDNASQLYELLNATFLHLTVSSTTLYEATLFDAPSVTLAFNNIDPKQNYGFETWEISDVSDVEAVLKQCLDSKKYENYLNYLKEKTLQYM